MTNKSALVLCKALERSNSYQQLIILKYKVKRKQIMNKEYLPVGISVVVMVALFIFYPRYYQPSFEPSRESIVFEDVSFVGFSKEPSNSMILYVKNTSGRIVLDHANITCNAGEKEFIIAPEEKDLPVDVSRRIVLFNVGWIENQDYFIDVYSSSGQLVGSILVTA